MQPEPQSTTLTTQAVLPDSISFTRHAFVISDSDVEQLSRDRGRVSQHTCYRIRETGAELNRPDAGCTVASDSMRLIAMPSSSLKRAVKQAKPAKKSARRDVLVSLSQRDFVQASIAAKGAKQTVAEWIADMVYTSTQP